MNQRQQIPLPASLNSQPSSLGTRFFGIGQSDRKALLQGTQGLTLIVGHE
jgi:hypothetical protein